MSTSRFRRISLVFFVSPGWVGLAWLFCDVGRRAAISAGGPPSSNLPTPKPNARTCPPKAVARTLLFSPRDTGEVVQGPACVGVVVNVLRYSAEFGRAVTYSQGPGLVAGFTPPTTPGGGSRQSTERHCQSA